MIDIARITVKNRWYPVFCLEVDNIFLILPDGSLLVAIAGCTVERNIPFRNMIPGSTTMDWYFVKTASKFEVWCQGKMVSALCSWVIITFEDNLSMVETHFTDHGDYNYYMLLISLVFFIIWRHFCFSDLPTIQFYFFSTTDRCFLTRVKLAARRWAATLLTSSLELTNLISPRRSDTPLKCKVLTDSITINQILNIVTMMCCQSWWKLRWQFTLKFWLQSDPEVPNIRVLSGFRVPHYLHNWVIECKGIGVWTIRELSNFINQHKCPEGTFIRL